MTTTAPPDKKEALLYTVRPDRTALWLPASLCAVLGIRLGAKLTAEQYEHPEVQAVLQARQQSERGKKEGGQP